MFRKLSKIAFILIVIIVIFSGKQVKTANALELQSYPSKKTVEHISKLFSLIDDDGMRYRSEEVIGSSDLRMIIFPTLELSSTPSTSTEMFSPSTRNITMGRLGGLPQSRRSSMSITTMTTLTTLI